MQRARLAVLLVSLGGCALLNPAPQTSAGANLTPEERFNARWAGRAEDDVLLQYGTPTETLSLASGNHVIGYHREVTSSESRSSFFQGSGGSRSSSGTRFCDRRFEIAKGTLHVVRAVITGTACDLRL